MPAFLRFLKLTLERESRRWCCWAGRSQSSAAGGGGNRFLRDCCIFCPSEAVAMCHRPVSFLPCVLQREDIGFANSPASQPFLPLRNVMRQLARNGLCVAAVVLFAGSSAFGNIFPEIDPGSGTAALVLLGGALAVIRGWRRQ